MAKSVMQVSHKNIVAMDFNRLLFRTSLLMDKLLSVCVNQILVTEMPMLILRGKLSHFHIDVFNLCIHISEG